MKPPLINAPFTAPTDTITEAELATEVERLEEARQLYLLDINPEDAEAFPVFKANTPPPETLVRKGKIDPRNPLNNLTGAEWVYFLASVDATAYPTKGPESFAHDLRKAHPSPKPPQLMRKLIEFFTKSGGWVLDPFVGAGGTLLGCSMAGRHGVGIDLEEQYLNIYTRVCQREGLAEQITIEGDSHNVIDLVQREPNAPQAFDLVLTDPPYGDMLARSQTGENRKRTGIAEATPFTDLATDLGNLPRKAFLKELRLIVRASVSLLKDKGYCVVFCKDLQPTREHHNMLHADVVEELLKIPDLAFKGYKIWHDKTPTLYPFGYPYAFVANQLHQFILIFRKEPVKPASKPRQTRETKKSVMEATNG